MIKEGSDPETGKKPELFEVFCKRIG